jgi:hypothetical protein
MIIYLCIALIILIVLIILIYIYISNNNKKNYYKISKDNIPNVKWPFINLVDENDKNINMLCIRGPLENEKDIDLFEQCINKKIKLIGCSSYLSFPGKCLNPYGDVDILYKGKPYYDYVEGWVHCFKNPDKYIKKNIPKLLLSESDFADNIKLKPDNTDKIYDFIVYCPKDETCESGWNYHNKNWKLCKKTIEILVNDFDQKGILIGRKDCKINLKNEKNLTQTGFLNYWDFTNKINQSKYTIIPSFEDASPRTLTESLLLNVPIFVNKDIIGGWKYVNDNTGRFYHETTIDKDFKSFLKNIDKYKPRKYFFDNYGIEKSGKKFKNFLKKINPELKDCKIIKFPVS